jgi:hypothetical protein
LAPSQQQDRTTMEVDYEVYAQGEALLGWVNYSWRLSGREFDGNDFLKGLLEGLHERFADRISIAHLKGTLVPDQGNDIAVDGSWFNSGATPPQFANITSVTAAAAPNRCSLNCTNQGEIYSFHSGGAHGGLGDASVQFLSSSIDLRVLMLISARGDGAVVDAAAFNQ